MRKNKIPGGRIVATASVAAIVPHETYSTKNFRRVLIEANRIQIPRVRRGKSGSRELCSSNRAYSERRELHTRRDIEQDVNRYQKENITINAICPGT
jgi:hypothetical protein